MSNEIEIEDTKRDKDMDGEIHHNRDCNTVRRNGTYIHDRDGREYTIKVLIIFMVCHCERKKSNPLPQFDLGQRIASGECIDNHLPDKGCYYKRYPQCDDDGTSFMFKCFCHCRDEYVSLSGK